MWTLRAFATLSSPSVPPDLPAVQSFARQLDYPEMPVTLCASAGPGRLWYLERSRVLIAGFQCSLQASCKLTHSFCGPDNWIIARLMESVASTLDLQVGF